jgi:hypothetical protein
MPNEPWIPAAIAALEGGAKLSAEPGNCLHRPKLGRARKIPPPDRETRAHPVPGGHRQPDAHGNAAAGNPIGRAKSQTPTTFHSRAHPDPGGQHLSDAHGNSAAGKPIGRAKKDSSPKRQTRAHPDPGGQAQHDAPRDSAAGKPIGRASLGSAPKGATRAHPVPGGQFEHAAHPGTAAGKPIGRAMKKSLSTTEARAHPVPGGQQQAAAHGKPAAGNDLLAALIEQWRLRQDMVRARVRLGNQAQAVCRRLCDGDKDRGQKLWDEVKADPVHSLRGWLGPFLAAIEPLQSAQRDLDRTIAKLAGALPIYSWAKAISGLGDISFGGLIAETAIGPGAYRSVAALWKRMGLAVINGERQRRVRGAEALIQGYAHERRTLMWNIGTAILKQQLRAPKDADGKRIEGESRAIGEFGQLYLDRKAWQVARNAERETPWPALHIHRDSQRYMEKRLLRQAWQAWRRACGISNDQPPYARRPLSDDTGEELAA